MFISTYQVTHVLLKVPNILLEPFTIQLAKMLLFQDI